MGRFGGRDPWSYVDGTSLYKAYFIPNKIDPMGYATAHISVQGSDGSETLDGTNGIRLNMVALYNKGKNGDCSCCKKIYWRQYAKSIVIGLRDTRWLWQEFEFDILRNDWHLDGGKIYDGDQYPDDHNPNATVYTMSDFPGAGLTTLNPSGRLKSIRQYFASQVICEKEDGTEIALTDQELWGHEYDYDQSPSHRFVKTDKKPIPAYDCKEGRTPSSAPSSTPTISGSIPAGPPRPPAPAPSQFPPPGWIPMGY